MINENSGNDIFRFLQLRPKKLVVETPVVLLLRNTPLATKVLSITNPARRISAANEALKDNSVTKSLEDVSRGKEISDGLSQLKGNRAATVKDLMTLVPDLESLPSSAGFKKTQETLSNTLLASFYATDNVPSQLHLLQEIYLVFDALLRSEKGEDVGAETVASVLNRQILLDVPTVPEPSRVPPRQKPDAPQNPEGHREILAAISELVALERSENLTQPKDGIAQKERPFTLTAAARKKLSAPTISLIRNRGIDLDLTPLDEVVQRISSAVANISSELVVVWPDPVVTVTPGVTLPPPPAQALVRPAGVADLLLVKQQIKRYEAGEIAHVENVLIGETKSRAHRQLERTEETFVTETEVTHQRETELETADRFELNRETSRTIKNDQQIGFGLSLSGKYGPTIEFSSNFSLNTNTSSEQSEKNSSRYARDVVNRSLERITQRTREQRTRTVIRETEETNLHELKNENTFHIRGIYQFIDKVYEAQIFNYGIREMFDFMVPEPASFLWYVAEHPNLDLELPPAPKPLDAIAPNAAFISEFNVFGLAAEYGATDIDAPPSLYKKLLTGVKHGEDNASEGDQPHSASRLDVQIPAGYRPLRARVRALAFTDENPVLGVTIGSHKVLWRPNAANRVALSDDHELAHEPELFLDLTADPYELTAESKVAVSVLAWETNTYSVEVELLVTRTPEEFRRWQLVTYKKIRTAHDEKVRQYEQRVEELRSEARDRAEREARRPFGAPPAENTRTVNTELKKFCISILTQQWYDAFNATQDTTPPVFDFADAAAEGSYIRFFEQAFEWDQMQYVFYPYFWARKTTWIDRFMKQEVDPQFQEFLKAGSARVVVPARPGFEVAVSHFLETGKLWNGEGDPPQINTPLYVSIVDEIRERTGAPQGEVAVGEPWDVRVPTALAILKETGDLPNWRRVAPGEWTWEPVPES